MQTQLDASNRRASTAENIIGNITQERDSAVSQLGVAYVTIEQLKAENEAYRIDILNLNDRIKQMTGEQDNYPCEQTSKSEALKQKIAQRSQIVPAAQNQSNLTNSQPHKGQSRTSNILDQSLPAATQGQIYRHPASDYEELFDLTPRPHEVQKTTGTHTSRQSANELLAQPGNIASNLRVDSGQPFSKREQMTYDAVGDNTIDTSRNLTYLSFIDTKDIANLRKTIESEHFEQKQREAARRGELVQDAVVRKSQIDEAHTTNRAKLPRKSSMKAIFETAKQNSHHSNTFKDGHDEVEHRRRHSEGSILSAKYRRRASSEKNMTSAFILPDITIRSTDNKNYGNLNENKGHEEPPTNPRETAMIPKPVPVSERMPEPIPGAEDPTMRPSQTPGLALATVIKNIEDEIRHLKTQLGSYQKLYNSHEPALSKRKRKYIYEKIESLLRAVDSKSDQLYALYDVLEGQKQQGQELTQDQFEVTLESIGLDMSQVEMTGGEVQQPRKKDAKRPAWDLGSDDGTDDGDNLPWEGIESTVETTKTGSTRGHKRPGSRF